MLIKDLFRPIIFSAPDEGGAGGGDIDQPANNGTADDSAAQPGAKATDQAAGADANADYDPTRDEEIARYKGVLAKQQQRINELTKGSQPDSSNKKPDQAADDGDILKSPLLKGLKVHKQYDDDTGEVSGHLVEYRGSMRTPEEVLEIRELQQFKEQVEGKFNDLDKSKSESELQKNAQEQNDTAEKAASHIISQSLPDMDAKTLNAVGLPIARAMAAQMIAEGATFDGELVVKCAQGAAQAVRKLIAEGVEAHLKAQQRPGGMRISPNGPHGKPGRKSGWDMSQADIDEASASAAGG